MKYNFLLLLVMLAVLVYVNCIDNSKKEKKENVPNPATSHREEKSDKSTAASIQITNVDEGIENTARVKSGAVLEVPKSSDTETEAKEKVGNSKILTAAELKEAMKHMQGDDVDPEEIKQIKNRFRKYEEIKKDLGELNLFPKSDVEIMKELMEKYKNAKSDEDIITILEDFDYLVHQYDNAQEFVNMNGFKEIVYKNLNSSNSGVRAEALRLLGSAVQHNAKVQIHALETDAVNILLKVLAIDTDYVVKNRAIFALSSLLRRYPIAQLIFIERSGLSVLSTLFDKPQDIKIQLKVATLLNDLLIEHRDALNDSSDIDYKEKSRQYRLVNLKEHLNDENWCQNFENLLKNIIVVDETDHDSMQRCLELMKSVSDSCASQFSGKTLMILKNMRKMYQSLALAEETDDFGTEYFLDMHKLCNEIIETINSKVIKTEL